MKIWLILLIIYITIMGIVAMVHEAKRGKQDVLEKEEEGVRGRVKP